MRNTYFDLTEELNAEGLIAVLASGQAVVFYRLALMSKAHEQICEIAERWLPYNPLETGA
jgi:hypothetical protein